MTSGVTPRISAAATEQRLLMLTALAANSMVMFDVAAFNMALPSIGRGLGATTTELQWMVAAGIMAYTVVPVFGGRLGDVWGSRRLFLLGVAGFTVASVGELMAGSALLLIALRAAQNAASGFISPQVMGLLHDEFAGQRRARVFAAVGMATGAAAALGPVVACILLSIGPVQLSWRWLFLSNTVLGALVLALACRSLPRAVTAPTASETVDYVGAATMGAAVLLMVVPLVQYRTLNAAQVTACVVLALLCTAALWWWQRRLLCRGRSAFVHPQLFGIGPYRRGVLIGTLFYAGPIQLALLWGLFLQLCWGYQPLEAGVVLACLAGGVVVGARLGGRQVLRCGRRWVAVGMVLVLLAMVATVVVLRGYATAVPGVSGGPMEWVVLTLLLTGAGLGVGMVSLPNFALSMHEVQADAGVASGLMQLGQRLGSLVGAAAVTSAFFVSMTAADAGQRGWVPLAAASVVIAIPTVAALAVAMVDARLGTCTSAAPVPIR